MGRFDLTGIPPAPRGVPQIEVEFAIDANGILNVAATDKATSKSQKIEITGSTGLSDDEIDRMKTEADSHADQDKERRKLVDLKNQADSMLYSTRKSLEEHGDKVTADVRGSIESSLKNLEEKVKEDDVPAIEAAMKQLSDCSIELGRAVYEAATHGTASEGATDQGGSSDDVIDAEYEVRDDNS